jgi:glycosyltransferase involved in cell wall biosynthesis
MPIRISVALCTFNGQAYLPEQLASLLAQHRKPDELVVRDDRSTDGTVAILKQFAATSPFPVSIEINETQLGPSQNFGRTLAGCGGDVIALCDQDDVWMPEKLTIVENEFQAQPGLGAFFSDAMMCDANGADLGYRLWTSVGLTGGLRRRLTRGAAFDVILRQNVVTGATLAFASRYRPLVLPIDPRWMHDGWIALLIAADGSVRADPHTLIRYRQHAAQSVGATRRSLFQQYLNARKMDRRVFDEQAGMYEAVLERLEQFSKSEWAASGLSQQRPSGAVLHQLAAKIRHCRIRSAIRLRERARLPASILELLSLRYRRFSLGWKSFAQDLFL